MASLFFLCQSFDVLFWDSLEFCVCLSASVFVSAVWPEFLTLSFVVQSAVKTHSLASHIYSHFGFVCLHDFPPGCQCHKGHPGIMYMLGFFRMTPWCRMMHAWANRWLWLEGEEVVTCFLMLMQQNAMQCCASCSQFIQAWWPPHCPIPWAVLKTALMFPVVTHWSH